MTEKKLPKKLIVRRYKEKTTYISFPGNQRQVLKQGVNEITNPEFIKHLYDDKINQGFKNLVAKGKHEVQEVF